MEMLVNKDAATSSAYYAPVKSDYCLCLAIHAPRKGIIEVYSSVFFSFGGSICILYLRLKDADRSVYPVSKFFVIA